MKPKINFQTIGLGMIVSMVFALIVSMFDNQVFRVISVRSPHWIEFEYVKLMASSLLLLLNVIPMILLSTMNCTRSSILRMASLYPIMIILSLTKSSTIVTIAGVLLCLFFRKDMKWGTLLFRIIFVNLIMVIYQQMALFIRMMILTSNYVFMDVATGAVMALDMNLFMIGLSVICLNRGEKNGLHSIRMVLRRRKIHPKGVAQTDSEVNKLDRAGLIVMQVIQLLMVALAVSINGKLLVFLMVYVFGFIPISRTLKHKYHASTYLACCWQTVLFFYVICAAVPSLNISILIPGIAGAIGGYGMSVLAYRISPKPTLDTMADDDLKELIESAKLNDTDKNFAILVWLEKIPLTKVERIVNYSYAWCRTRKRSLRIRLEELI